MSDIKSQVEECLKQAEEIERAGVIKDKLNTTIRIPQVFSISQRRRRLC